MTLDKPDSANIKPRLLSYLPTGYKNTRRAEQYGNISEVGRISFVVPWKCWHYCFGRSQVMEKQILIDNLKDRQD